MRKILILVFSLFSIFSTVEAKSKKGQDRVLIDKVAMWQVNHQSKVKHHDLADRKSTRLNSSHRHTSRMPSSA